MLAISLRGRGWALIALLATLQQATPLGAYFGFVGGMALWAWHELSYFLGFVTGPRPAPVKPGAGIGQRFVLGVQASLYHELAIVLTAAVLWWLSFERPTRSACGPSYCCGRCAGPPS